MRKVLFLCVHNSARSQMAEAYLKLFASIELEVQSAGLEPGKLNPYVVRALREDGIDISSHETRSAFDLHRAGETFDYVVTVCSPEAAERCPVFPGHSTKLHWPFPDPSTFAGTDEQIMEQVREVRDAIRDRVRQFADDVLGREMQSYMTP
jgi:arsenate reductase (thioredoxin)